MGAFDNLNFGAGQDDFQVLYDNYNLTMDALKAGTNFKLLRGAGIGSDPVFESYFDTPVVVGSGGAPAFDINFAAANNALFTIAYKKSAIANTVSIFGRWKRITTNLPSGSSPAILFTLPVGYRPTKPNGFICLGSNIGGGTPTTDFTPISVSVDTSGNVFIINRSLIDIPIDFQADMDITFTIS